MAVALRRPCSSRGRTKMSYYLYALKLLEAATTDEIAEIALGLYGQAEYYSRLDLDERQFDLVNPNRAAFERTFNSLWWGLSGADGSGGEQHALAMRYNDAVHTAWHLPMNLAARKYSLRNVRHFVGGLPTQKLRRQILTMAQVSMQFLGLHTLSELEVDSIAAIQRLGYGGDWRVASQAASLLVQRLGLDYFMKLRPEIP